MPRYKESIREETLRDTRRALLNAAIDEFAREGYVGANIDRISKASGYAKGTFYNHFMSKRALMLALIEEIAERHLDYVSSRFLQENDAGKRVELFFEAGFTFVSAYLAQAQLMVNNIFGPHAEFKEAMYQAYQPMFELVGKEIIGIGMAQGIFRRVDPVSTAGLVMNIYLGAASQINEEGKPWIQASEVADFVVRALRNSI